MKALFRAGLLATLVLCAPLGAGALEQPAFKAANTALAQGVILPGFTRLAAATGALDAAARHFCTAPDAQGLAAVRDRFATALDAWMAVEHLQFGPMVLFMRNHRANFWPDARNTAGRQMAGMLAGRDEAAIAPQVFATGSVAVQGFPALERLLFEDGPALLAGDADAAYRCRYVTAVTANLAGIGADLDREWRDYAGGFPDGAFETPRQATAELLKHFTAGLQKVADLKLGKPLGDTPDRANPRLTEGWRSGRALATIETNLTALRDLYTGRDGDGLQALVAAAGVDPDLNPLMRDGFAAVLETVRSIRPPLGDALADPQQRAAVERLRQQVAALQTLATTRLAPALDIPLGFNSMDGD